MTRQTLNAKTRTLFGRKVKKLRREHLLPANIFGKKTDSTAIQLEITSFQKVFNQSGETSLIDLVVDGQKPRPVLITNIQTDPVLDTTIHVDFHQVDLTEKVTANIPVEVIGESPAVKDKGAVLVTVLNEIEVEALPGDLPEKFEIDISTLKEFGDNITVAAIKAGTKIEIKLAPEETVVLVQEPREEVVEEVAPAVDAEVATPAEGDVKPEAAKPDEGGGDSKSE